MIRIEVLGDMRGDRINNIRGNCLSLNTAGGRDRPEPRDFDKSIFRIIGYGMAQTSLLLMPVFSSQRPKVGEFIISF